MEEGNSYQTYHWTRNSSRAVEPSWEQCSKFTGCKHEGDVNGQLMLNFTSSKSWFSITVSHIITDNVKHSWSESSEGTDSQPCEGSYSVESIKPNGRSSSSTQIMVKPQDSSGQEAVYARSLPGCKR